MLHWIGTQKNLIQKWFIGLALLWQERIHTWAGTQCVKLF